ncbi:MAG TPA: hypothetical protein VIL19_01305 [Casimicrobiaceae bacterium]
MRSTSMFSPLPTAAETQRASSARAAALVTAHTSVASASTAACIARHLRVARAVN